MRLSLTVVWTVNESEGLFFCSVFQGIITYLGPEEGIINSDEHGELPFDICENFSDTEFNTTDIHKEAEFTVAMVREREHPKEYGK